MTDDIVARIRNAFDGDDVPTKNIALRHAADEIARLRSYFDAHAATIQQQSDEIERLRAYFDAHATTIQQQSDEIERLRAAAEMALETLIGCCVSAGGVDDRKTILEAQDMLCAALEGEKKDD